MAQLDVATNDTGILTAVGQIAGGIRTPHFFRDCAEVMRDAFGAGHVSVFMYYRNDPPDCIFSDLPSSGVQNYVTQTYKLCPLYQLQKEGIVRGAYQMRSLRASVPPPAKALPAEYVPAPSENTGFITSGWPAGFEELDIVLPGVGPAVVSLELLRARGLGGFDAKQLEAAQQWSLVLSALVNCHLVMETAFPDPAQPTGADFAGLSPREREVADYILNGYSSHAIAASLGTRLSTIKTHRQRIYRKLGISSMNELHALQRKSSGGRVLPSCPPLGG